MRLKGNMPEAGCRVKAWGIRRLNWYLSAAGLREKVDICDRGFVASARALVSAHPCQPLLKPTAAQPRWPTHCCTNAGAAAAAAGAAVAERAGELRHRPPLGQTTAPEQEGPHCGACQGARQTRWWGIGDGVGRVKGARWQMLRYAEG